MFRQRHLDSVDGIIGVQIAEVGIHFHIRITVCPGDVGAGRGDVPLVDVADGGYSYIRQPEEGTHVRLPLIAYTQHAQRDLVTVTIAGTLIAVLMGSFIGLLTVSTITRQLGGEPADIAALAKQVSGGDLSMALVSEKKNAIGLYASLIRMVENLNAVVGQADAISRGDYTEKIEPRSDRDDLGHALARMTDKLRRVSAENELESRQKTGHNDLNDQLRGEQDSAALADAVITYLAEFFGAQVGAFYLASEDGMLALCASYAYRKRKGLSSRFAVGEGLVGQAARERKPILVTEVPEALYPDHLRPGERRSRQYTGLSRTAYGRAQGGHRAWIGPALFRP